MIRSTGNNTISTEEKHARTMPKAREVTIVASISGGADAVRAINGAAVRALNPPIFSKVVLKSRPLLHIIALLSQYLTFIGLRQPTILLCSEPRQWQLSPKTFAGHYLCMRTCGAIHQ